jgi:hypothetical protein
MLFSAIIIFEFSIPTAVVLFFLVIKIYVNFYECHMTEVIHAQTKKESPPRWDPPLGPSPLGFAVLTVITLPSKLVLLTRHKSIRKKLGNISI